MSHKIGNTDVNLLTNVSQTVRSAERVKDLHDQNELQQTVGTLQNTTNTIKTLNSGIQMNEADINRLKGQLSTRDRMLQVSIEKNVYKRKIIFTLISVILLIIILMGAGFFYLRK